MKLDRTLQKQLLDLLAKAYPEPVLHADLSKRFYTAHTDPLALSVNIAYLVEHQLIYRDETSPLAYHCTARALDMLAADGGITAICTSTILLQENTLRSLLELRILQSDLTEEEKTSCLQGLKNLPVSGIKHLTLGLIDSALSEWPQALEHIRRLASI